MERNPLESVFGFVTDHNLVVLVVLLALSAGVVSGASDLQTESEAGGNLSGQTTVAQKADYVRTHYESGNRSEPPTEPAVVYLRGENVLSKTALLDSLRFRRAARKNGSVSALLTDGGGVADVSTLVARRLAGDRSADLAAQIAALEAATPDEVESAVRRVLGAGSPALELLPRDYEPGSATAESRRIVFRLASGEASVREAATKALYDLAEERTTPTYFTVGEHAQAANSRHWFQNSVELIVPFALVVILAVLAFAYRDLVDVFVGFAGVILAVLWMFGILGWLRVAAGFTVIIGPVLIVGLSVDYGLHVFMRYREQRSPGEGIRAPMGRALSAVAVALALVTLTAAVGFLSNLSNPVVSIKNLAIGITLGVVSAFVIFTTLVPALKVTIDGLLERVGLNRRKAPLGKSGALRRFLSGGVTLARRGAPVVIALALLAGSAGAVAWGGLERQGFQQDTDGIAEWKQDLPEPLAWSPSSFGRHIEYVTAHYRSANENDRRVSRILIEGNVTDPAVLDRLASVEADLAGSNAVFTRRGQAPIVSVLAVMREVAAGDEAFARRLKAADTDDDFAPDRSLSEVYDALYASAPTKASEVLERHGGEYRSLLVTVPIDRSVTFATQADAMREAADAIDAPGVEATAVGQATITEAELRRIADGILTTLLVALAAIAFLLVVVYRVVVGSATLGAITVLPIGLVTALVVGGMYVFGVPLTTLTALLMSLVIGVGIDYNIHVSDRFAQELDRGRNAVEALEEAVTGTGGALLGSTLTTTGAFSALLLHPHPQLQSFGTLVLLALSLSFLVSVFVFPSLLWVWATRTGAPTTRETPAGAASDD